MRVKGSKEYSEEQLLSMMLHGVDYPVYVANMDKENYAKFKEGNSEEFSEETLRDMNILSILERLGYCMDELGTYLYKDVVANAYEVLKDASSRTDVDRCRQLLAELNDAFSQFYHDIAREDKDMGVTSFHVYIQKALDKIDEKAVDAELASKVYGSSSEDMSYGTHAFQLASYAANLYSNSMQEEIKKPRVLALSNTPKGYTVKDNY